MVIDRAQKREGWQDGNETERINTETRREENNIEAEEQKKKQARRKKRST